MGASLSAEEIKKMMTGNTTEKYLGGYGGHSPLLDLVNRLSGQLNQQTAESNLYRGGSGYGGSFESESQKAARAKGQTENAKPYGGWGGYGSENSTMTNKPGAGGPTTTISEDGPPVHIPTDGVITSDGQPVPIPGGGSVATGPAPTPLPYTSPRSSPYTGEQPTSTMTTGQAASPYQLIKNQPYWKGKPINAANQAAIESDPDYIAYNESQQARAQEAAGLQRDPKRVAAQKEAAALERRMVAKGLDTTNGSQLDGNGIANALIAGVPIETIEKHYDRLMAEMGPQFHSISHGWHKQLDTEALKNGTMTERTLKNAGGVKAPAAANFKPPTKKAGTAAPTGGGQSQKAAPGMEASNYGQQSSPYGTGENADGGGDNPVLPPGTVPPTPPPVPPPVPPPGGTVTPTTRIPYKTQKNWGQQSTPPKNAQPGDVWQLPNGAWMTMLRSGVIGNVNMEPDGTFTFESFHSPETPGTGPENQDPNGTGFQPPDPNLPPTLLNPHAPKIPGSQITATPGQRAVIGYDENGNPIFNDNGMFEQGDNASGLGDYTPDAWSTSEPWRPEEPTGGVYGAFSDLAGGKMTDYENAVGQQWRDMAGNPITPQDTNYETALAEYNKTPGKGIDEAYGAYNTMINSNGYSDAERGAIEGSAVSGVSNAYQRNADELRRQGARTGNRASALAAMATGGAEYGATLGSLNRDNQVKFADEAQRRKEAGASGMTNVASLASTKSQFGLNSQQNYANELQRRREMATKGMGDYATFGRGLQAQGIAGLSDMLKSSNADKNNTYAQIAAILGTNVGQASSGTADTKQHGWNAGVQI